jgi:hypothetical protein
MKKVALWVTLVGLVLLALVDAGLSWLSTELANVTSKNHPSPTIAASKGRGAFVEPVTFTPSVINWNGERIIVREAWLEHRTELVRIYEIVPFLWAYSHYRNADGYNLCFNLDQRRDVLGSPGPSFYVEGKGRSFGEQYSRGSVVLWEELDDIGQFPMRIELTDRKNWRILVVERGPQ